MVFIQKQVQIGSQGFLDIGHVHKDLHIFCGTD